MLIWENSVPAIANDLIRLIQDRRYDHHRGPLCPALAKTKHPRAADVIASVMNEKWMGLFCIEGLKRLPGAAKHVEKIKKLLGDSDSEIRRAAKKLLKKLGVDVEPAPPALHLIGSKGKVPKDLEEWSSNLDTDDLRPTLQKLSQSVDQGFGAAEIHENCPHVAGIRIWLPFRVSGNLCAESVARSGLVRLGGRSRALGDTQP